MFISVLCSVYLVEYTLNPNSMIEIGPELYLNPIRSGGGGGFKSPPPLSFCPHAFNFGATLLCVGTFPKK